jgi:hypothetical protein
LLDERPIDDRHPALAECEILRQQRGRRYVAQAVDRRGTEALAERRARPLGVRQALHRGHAEALRDRAGKEAARARRRHHVHDPGGAGRLAEDRDAVRVAAERRDVAPDPAERRGHVEQAVVAGAGPAGFGGQLRMGHEPERPQPVVERDEHDALARQVAPHEDRIAARALLKRATVEPDHHRPARVGGRGRAPYIEIEAVFAHRLLAGELGIDRIVRSPGLQALRRQCGGGSDTVPAPDRLRRLPAQRADRRRRIWNAEKGPHLAVRVVSTVDEAAVDRDGQPVIVLLCGRHACSVGFRRSAQAKLGFLPSISIGTL